MPVAIDFPNKRETLNIRIRAEERGLIDRAAAIRGKNRTDFILDAARLAAEEARASSAARRAASRIKSVRFFPRIAAARSIKPRSSALIRMFRVSRLFGKSMATGMGFSPGRLHPTTP